MKFLLFLIAGLVLPALSGGTASGAPLGAAPKAASSRPAEQKPSTRVKPPSGAARTIVLWPAGAPGAVGHEDGDVPKLYYYPATLGTENSHSAVIVLPGGGYRALMTEKEGAAAARWLNAHGVAAFVLVYRLGQRYEFPAPMLDGARAVRYVRSHAEDFGVQPNKVGVWGFSAGGHLAGYLASVHEKGDLKAIDPVERVSDRPDFAIISYGRLSMDSSIPRETNMEGLLGNNPTPEKIKAVSIEQLVTKDTSPSFIYSTTADQTVNSENATAYYDALKRQGVPVELHIFERGAHGTGIGIGVKGLPELEEYTVLLGYWMQTHGWMAEAKNKE
jgi:acetyl esterase/lipase